MLFLFLTSSVFLLTNFYINNTEKVAAEGGKYTEGLISSPRFINPVYSPAYDVDRDLVELIYSGLMKYNAKGEIVTDLAERYEILQEGRVFEFYLEENLLWQDTKPLTADDIVFTIKAIQNPTLKSPIRANWLGVTVEKISDLGIRFELKNPSAVFLENATVKILPKHIWENVAYQNFPLSIYNLQPIGSGPYKLKDFSQDGQGNIKSLELVTNPTYSGPRPNIPKITFLFFENEDKLIKAFNSGKVQGISLYSPQKYQEVKEKGYLEYRLSLPRYFAAFFNPAESKILEEKKVREALSHGTDKEEIIEKALSGRGLKVNSPILPEIYGFEVLPENYSFDQELANQILEEAGYLKGDDGARSKFVKKTPSFQFSSNLQKGSKGSEVTELQKCLAKDPAVYPEAEITGNFGSKTEIAVIRFQEKYAKDILTPYGLTSGTGKVYKSTRTKLNEICNPTIEETLSLSFTLKTADQPTLKAVADILKEQWQKIGVNLKIETFSTSKLEEDVIKPRDYEMLLFGEVLGTVPDPFPFWHSSQIKNPGLNLAGYENSECDKLLERARQTLDGGKRKEALENFQKIIVGDLPALFLYSPDYLYLVTDDIKGIEEGLIADPSKRFAEAENWYIKTKRVW
ncbi:MAG: ABC transporter substrate-binding protein [bacterium]|nr:ABC transporter substrate-binding protein [bacterium]